MLAFTVLLICSYWGFVLLAIKGWRKAIQPSNDRNTQDGLQQLDVLIPYRDEELHLKRLVHEIIAQKSDLSGIRFIFIDDHSEDSGHEIVEESKKALDLISLINTGEGKKAALEVGLTHVITKHVLFWDADISIGPQYFRALRNTFQGDLTILPVIPIEQTGTWASYAALDFLSLIGMTFSWAALQRPIMANGANLLVMRDDVFLDPKTASGDDVQTLHRIKERGGVVHYDLDKRLIVKTQMPKDFKTFFHQRMRWAAKSSQYSDNDTLLIGWYTVLFQVGLLIGLIYFMVQGAWTIAFALFLFKAFADFLFLHLVTKHFSVQKTMRFFFPASFLNLFMTPLVFIASRLFSFKWKERKYRS
jgi:cellulose synthase/poly-beta-1,6-N-acetylglucosamine synthase-like glycosyltransferase